jgi:PAS domain S-box-containing protein
MTARVRIVGFKFWTYISVLLLAAIAGLDAALGEDVRLFGSYLLPIFVAGLTTTPRRTAFVGALALVTMFSMTTFGDQNNGATEIVIRLVVAFVGAALALQTAVLRERDLRTRRRLALINIARTELEATTGLEEDLISFARAASHEFADWAILDVRIQDGSATRTICHGESVMVAEGDSMPRANVTAAAAAYAARAQNEGPIIVHHADRNLIEALFEDFDAPKLRKAHVLVLPITIGTVTATYFLVCPEPYPPWGAAELTQADSLARAAALAARRDQLIDQLSFAQEELRASRDQVTAIIKGIADGVTAQSADGMMIYANERAAEMLGYASADDIIGKPFSAVHPNMELRDENNDPFDPNQLPSRRALAGEAEPSALLRYTVIPTGREWWTLVKSRAIFNDEGKPLMAISIIEDQTAQRMQSLAQQVLADAGKLLVEASGLEETIARAASAAVPGIADWCAVELLDGGHKIFRTAVAEAPDKLSQPEKQPAPASAMNVATSGVPELLASNDSVELAKTIGMQLDDDTEVQSAMIVPIFDRGRPVGAITFAQLRTGTRFTEYDLETALEYGRRAGVAIEGARDMEDRARMLDTLRSSLLPRELPEYEGIELAARFRPAQAEVDVSGDFYDAFTLSDGSTALVIGDVCGKGPEAAAITALARYTIRTDAMTKIHPAEILRTLNQALKDQVSPDTFCTVALIRLSASDDPEVHSLAEVASGGHPLPVLIEADGSARAIGEVGTLLGIVPEPELPVNTVEVKHGESIVLYTDGLSGGRTTDDLGYALLLAREVGSGTAQEIAVGLDNAAIASQTQPSRDDVAILVARLTQS